MTVLGAGVLCWRIINEQPYILVIHRPRHEDISFPKGKIDPGEIAPVAAVRELWEESGMRAALGPYIGQVDYTFGSSHKPKTVFYWSAHVTAAQAVAATKEFAPNKEVDETFWMSIGDASHMLTYDHDRRLLAIFAEKLSHHQAEAVPLIVLRHAKALNRKDWHEDDADRPLSEHGEKQAKELARDLAPWGALKIISSPWKRCLQTITPYAQALHLDVAEEPLLSERGYAADAKATEQFAADCVATGAPTIVCSHKPVLPGILSGIGGTISDETRANLLIHASMATAGFIVLSLAAEPDGSLRLVAADRHETFL